MTITSLAFTDGSEIPRKYSCEGENINPPLAIDGLPEGSESLALVMHDPDAPMQGGFTHWVVLNMAPAKTEIEEGKGPSTGVEALNGAGKTGYMGPCPSVGPLVHHYEFDVYALDEKMNLGTDATKVDVEREMQGHILDQAKLVGTYQMSDRSE